MTPDRYQQVCNLLHRVLERRPEDRTSYLRETCDPDDELEEHALAFAETGHLAISTLHANNANQALDRIINFFPEERRPQLLQDISSNIRAFVSQRLVVTTDGKRKAGVEVLLGTPTIQELIKRGEFSMIKEVMEKSEMLGMQTFDGAMFKLYKAGHIDLEEALKNADSPNNLRLRISLSEKGEDKPGDDGKQEKNASSMNLSLEEIAVPEDEEGEEV